MAKTKQEYRRLPGKGTSGANILWYNRYTIWLGNDHLLSVNNHVYSEDYKRFYFKDIQAIQVQQTAGGRIRAILLGFFSLASATFMAGFWLGWHVSLPTIAACFTGVFAFFFLINWLMGPTCVTYLYTAVQTERLYSLGRVKTAMRVIRQLRQPIGEAQGELTAEEIHARTAVPTAAEQRDVNDSAPHQQPIPARVVRPRAVRTGPLKSYHGRAHEVLFAILLADLCHSCLSLFVHSPFIMLVGAVFAAAMVCAMIVAMVRQNNTDMDGGIKTCVWCVLAYIVVSNIFSFIYSSVFTISHPGLQPNSWEYMKAVSSVSPLDSPSRLAMLIFSIICAGGVGFTGLVLLKRYRDRQIEHPTPNTPHPTGQGRELPPPPPG